MRKSDLVLLFGSHTAAAQAAGVSKSAFSQWRAVPKLRQYELRDKYPDINERIAALPKRRKPAAAGDTGRGDKREKVA